MTRVVDPPRSDKSTSVAVLFLGFMGAIQMADPIIASLALVKATQALSFTPEVQAFAASVSTLALAATVVPSGVVADKIGRRRMIVGALLLTTLGDVLAASATGSAMFLVGRAIAGVGLGAVFAGSFGFVRSVVTDRAFAPALGIFAAMCSVPLFVFMPLSSALAGVSWRLTFLVIPVVCIISALLCFKLLPDLAPLPPAPREYWGVTALGIGIVALLLGISRMAKSFTSPSTWIPIAVGAVFLAAFVLVERRAAHPVFPVSLFTSPLFIAGALGGFAWNAASATGQLLSSNLWQYVLGFTPFSASVRQLPLMLFSIIASVLAGMVMGRGRSSIGVLVGGGVLTALGLVLTGLLAGSSGGLLFLTVLCVASFGAGVMTVPQSQMFVLEAPPDYYGPVTSSRTCVGQLGYAIGLAGGAAIASGIAVSQLVANAGMTADQASQELGNFLVGTGDAGEAVKTAYTDGFSVAMYAFAALVVLCTVVILLLGRSAMERSRERTAATASPVAAA